MLCSNCNTDNPADAAFCEQCGSKLELLCPGCKVAVNPGARFCKKCGTALGALLADASKKSNIAPLRIVDAPSAENLAGERKTVTALFADIKGSTELMEELDPEEARSIIDPALKLMIEAAHRYDGYVVQSTGDGIFALFGAPTAHVPSAARVVRGAQAARGAETVFGQSADRGRLADSGPHRNQHRRSSSPFDYYWRGSD